MARGHRSRGGTEIGPAGFGAVVAQIAKIMAVITGYRRVQETPHTGAGVSDQPQEGAVVKVRKRLFFGSPPFYFTAVLFDPVFRPDDRGKALRAPGQPIFKGGPGKIRHIIQPAAGPAGHPFPHLAEINRRGVFTITFCGRTYVINSHKVRSVSSSFRAPTGRPCRLPVSGNTSPACVRLLPQSGRPQVVPARGLENGF